MNITLDDLQQFKANGGLIMPLCRSFAAQLIDAALLSEAKDFVGLHGGMTLADGRKRIVLSGTYPRSLLTQVGNLDLNVPVVRDRGGKENSEFQFKPSFLPPFLRKDKELEGLIPLLYLKGISQADIAGAVSWMHGTDSTGLSSSTVSSLIRSWTADFQEWSVRSLIDGPEYPYIFGDGIFFPIRGAKEHQTVLALIGVNSEGRKELLAVDTGFAETAEQWKAMFLDLKSRGMKSPKLVAGDAALGLWAGLKDVYPDCAAQACWVHKMRNVQSHLPKKQRSIVMEDLREIMRQPSRNDAEKEIEKFSSVYSRKYPKAVESLTSNTDRLLSFYNFPAEHWPHIRTTNIIESIFSTVRARTHKMRGVREIRTMKMMVFRLVQAASAKFQKITGAHLLKDVCEGRKFVDGEPEKGRKRKKH